MTYKEWMAMKNEGGREGIGSREQGMKEEKTAVNS